MNKRKSYDKDLLIRLYMNGYSYAEIAEKMGVPESGVGSRISTLRGKGYNLPYRKIESPEQKLAKQASLATSGMRLWK